MSKESGVWLFARGTLKAHYVKDGKALCGRKLVTEVTAEPHSKEARDFLERCKCKACQKALVHFSDNQGEQTK
jgi:hypothetical protein